MVLTANSPAQVTARQVSGTGFHVTASSIVTCAHVVNGASSVEIVDARGIRKTARVDAIDTVSDLAILRVAGTAPGTLQMARPAASGVMDSIMVVGFPMASAIGTEISASEGRINAVRQTPTGPILQIDAVINPGNSGGPILDNFGAVAGVAVAKLEASGAAGGMGGNPERLNFAIPAETVVSVCAKNGLRLQSSPSRRTLDPKSIFLKAQAATVLVYATQGGDPMETRGTSRANPDEKKAARWAADFVAAMDGSTIDKELRFYGDSVDFLQYGQINKRQLREIIKDRRKTWPKRSYVLQETGILNKTTSDDSAGVGMVFSYKMSGPGNTKQAGQMQIVVMLSEFSKKPSIVYYREGLPGSGP